MSANLFRVSEFKIIYFAGQLSKLFSVEFDLLKYIILFFFLESIFEVYWMEIALNVYIAC